MSGCQTDNNSDDDDDDATYSQLSSLIMVAASAARLRLGPIHCCNTRSYGSEQQDKKEKKSSQHKEQ